MKTEMMDEYERACRELIAGTGNEIGIHTSKCVAWHKDHDNCFGCPCELGCSQLVALELASMSSKSNGLFKQILDSKDPEIIRKMDFDYYGR